MDFETLKRACLTATANEKEERGYNDSNLHALASLFYQNAFNCQTDNVKRLSEAILGEKIPDGGDNTAFAPLCGVKYEGKVGIVSWVEDDRDRMKMRFFRNGELRFSSAFRAYDVVLATEKEIEELFDLIEARGQQEQAIKRLTAHFAIVQI